METNSSSLAGRFRSLIEGVCRALVEGNGDNRCPEPVINLILAYLRRLAARFVALTARGPVARPARPRPPHLRTSRACPALVQRAPRILPVHYWGWLAPLLPDPAPHAAEMYALADTREMISLVAAIPELGKLLRPLAVALGVGLPPELRLPTTPREKIAAECREARRRFIPLKLRKRLGMPLVDRHHRPWVRPTLKRWLRSKTRPARC